MALWGNSDNVTSTGTVSLTYATGEVVGSGTSFSSDLKVGQVIRFGNRGGGTYFGDAVITGITSETVLTIGSTAGLSGASIASTDFTVSELPKYTILDSSFSETLAASPTLISQGITGTATTNAGVGTDIIPVVVGDIDVIVGDTLTNGGSDIAINTIGTTTISLASTISSGISTGDALSFKRYTGGYDKLVYGISTGASNAYAGVTSSYRLDGEGWVGVTTCIDTHGELRVKKEILVAMSGITTGSIDYPTPV